MLCTLSTNSSKDILNAVVCPCSTILYSMGDSGLSTVHIYTYLIFWCQNVVWLRITCRSCRWICPTSLLHAWKCTTVGCGSFHGQYWTLHTVFRKESPKTSPWSICFVWAMRAFCQTPSTSYKNPINPISGRRILWRSPRKKSNTDVSTMFGVAVGQNSLKVHGEFAPQPNSARPKMWDLTRHVSLICSYLFHFISPRCTRHSRSKYFLQKPGNLCSCTFTLSNHGFSELPALYILYMASESNTKLTAPQGLAAGKLKGRPKGATKPESRAHFSKIQGNRSNRYPNILYLSLLVLHHDASFWLIRWVYHRLSVFCCPTIRFFNAELPNNTLMKFASQSLHRVLRIATAIMEIPVQHANFS